MKVRSILRNLPAQEEILGDPDVCIAVLDGPVDLSHPCFAGADVRRIHTLVQDPSGRGPMSMHGTHVASLLFGQPGTSVVGIAPRCRGLVLPVFRDGPEGRVPQLDLARAVERAVEEGAHVINISGGERSADGRAESMLERALRRCHENGVLVVAAVGNDGCDCLQAPAAAPSVLAVGATDTSGEPLDTNNWGVAYRTNGVLAPGQEIEGATPGGGRLALTGSSFATPAVSGVAALLVTAQLREGRRADPIAAGRAILETATVSSCSPSDAPECRRHLVGHLDAARAYDLIRRGSTTVIDLDVATVPSRPVPPVERQTVTTSSGSGVNAASESSLLRISHAESNEGANAMDTSDAHATAGEAADTTGERAENADAAPPSSPHAQPIAQQAESVSPEPGVHAAGEPSPLEANHSEPNEGTNSMETHHAHASAHQGAITTGTESGAAPPVSAQGPAAPSGSAQLPGVRPSCGCGGSPSSGCQCGGNGSSRSLIYAIGTIGFDFQTEARRDSFRQQMPYAFTPADQSPDGVEREVQPNIYDPAQLHAYLSKNPWASDKLTWTLTMDATPIYALEAEMPAGMDWHRPIISDPRATSEQVRKAAGSAADERDNLAEIVETLSYPPVSTVYRTFRDALLGQIQNTDDPNYVSRVSIPGVLTDRTVRLYSGQVVPVVEVKSRGLYTWNEALLVDAVVQAVTADYEEREVPLDEEKRDNLRTTVRALLDKVYWQFRNLGQSSADRALNAAGTNAFLVGSEMRDGLLSAKHLPGKDDNFYTLDTVRVSKSPFCRPGSDCQEVILEFFDPENDRRARVSYLFTFDVSDELPVSLAPVHKFIGGM
ncbi:S8 family serine peptidase [Streptomyces sp. ISL-1]|uniref:cyanobactin maturation protease PatG family protein n=1 Tax=Streptomyces sp. ISL-1 TaxID=2817657 RepID=UPI001BE9FEE1|nr:S8 family serine peptidase [Streptomyces sp. ISL-1]MBT2393406.1 S8 family serine peptidase [Streptomyces sp. ISL-1]